MQLSETGMNAALGPLTFVAHAIQDIFLVDTFFDSRVP